MMDRTSDIASACGVHPSAVVRFAQRFGFSGFSDLQAVFKQAYTGQSGSPQSYQQRIRKLIDEKAGKVSGVLGGARVHRGEPRRASTNSKQVSTTSSSKPP